MVMMLTIACDPIQSAKNKIYEPVHPTVRDVNATKLNVTVDEAIDWEKYDLLLPHKGNLTFYFLDLPGTPVLVTFPYGSTAIINSGDGTDTARIYNYVRNLGYKNIDYMFLSNFNSYRLGGAGTIARKANINISYDRGGATNTKIFNDYINYVNKRKPIGVVTDLEIDGVDIIITPGFDYSLDKHEEDYNTLLFQFDYGDFTLLHAGDCIDECEDVFDRQNFDADVFIAGKNGDCLGTTTFILNKITPELIVFDNSINEVCDDVQVRVNYLNIDNIKLQQGKKFFITTDGTVY